MIAESLDPVTDGPVPMSQTLRANFATITAGPLVDLNGDQFKDKHIWLCYTVVSEEGPDLKVCEYYNNKEAAKDEVIADLTPAVRKKVTMRRKAIENMTESVAPLQWYKPILTKISFPDLHFQK